MNFCKNIEEHVGDCSSLKDWQMLHVNMMKRENDKVSKDNDSILTSLPSRNL
jgi:hypothetical protein